MAHSSVDIWKKAIQALAARNGPLDLARASGDDSLVEWYRSQVFSLSPNGEMLVERPAAIGVASAMAEGKRVIVMISADGRRWQGVAEVLAKERVALNKVTMLPALRLSPASDIRSGQRRRYYRIGLSALDLKKLVVTREADGEDVKPLDVHIVNLSAGGLGLRVPATVKNTSELRNGLVFKCVLQLQDQPEVFELSARLVHVERMAQREIYLGLEFEFNDPLVERRMRDDLARVVTEAERVQLRRMRAAG